MGRGVEVREALSEAPGSVLRMFGGALGVCRGAFWKEFIGWEGSDGENGDTREIDVLYDTLAMFLKSKG